MSRTLLIVALVGCSFNGNGEPAGPHGDAKVADTNLLVDVPAVDRDNDGVFDALDNCPDKANPDQHDEDGDLAGDICDPCPTVPDEGTANMDADKLPDKCDPRPMQAGDFIAELETFAVAGAGLPLGWDVIEGNVADFTRANDALVMAGGTSLAMRTVGFTNMGVEAGFSSQTIGNATSSFLVLADATDSPVVQWIGCGFRYDLTQRVFLKQDGASSTTIATSAVAPSTATQGYRVGLLSANQAQACAIVPDGMTGSRLEGTEMREDNQHIGLRSVNTMTTVRYVIVYRY